jgi:hypothetical protein
MKIQIDTKGKTVKLMENYPIKDVLKELKKIVDDWDDYTLIAYEEKWNYYPSWTPPYIPPYEVTCYGATGTIDMKYNDDTLTVTN